MLDSNQLLPTKAIEEFKKLYFQEYGIKLSSENALEEALKILILCKVVYKISSKEAL